MKDLKPDIHIYTARIPKYLYKKLEEKAAKTMYSVNLLIVEAIVKSLKSK